MKRRIGVIIAAVIVVAGAAGTYAAWRVHHAYHLATVQDGVLYRDGARSTAQFSSAIEQVHPRTVVSLVDRNEESDPNKPQLADEAQLCSSHGIRLERVEVTLGGWPSSDDVRRFLSIVSDKQNQPVLVHCAQGVRRTGFFVAAFQESVLGYDKSSAKDAILTFGHSERTINDIKRFIDHYDPNTRTVSANLQTRNVQ